MKAEAPSILVLTALLLFTTGATPRALASCPSGDVEGYACAPSFTAIVSSARATLTYIDCDANPQIVSTTSDVAGYFSFTNIPAGNWNLVVEKGPYKRNAFAPVTANQTTTLPMGATCFNPAETSIAVVSGSDDAFQNTITDLGFLYELFDGENESWEGWNFLLDAQRVVDYDITIINAGFHPEAGFGDYMGDVAAIGQNLNSYANQGGYIYASDWAYYAVEAAFSAQIDFKGDDLTAGDVFAGSGVDHTVNVLDPELAGYLGQSSVTLDMDHPSWAVMESAGPNTRTYLKGDALLDSGGTVPNAPFMVSFPHGSGSILYTSYHRRPGQAVDDLFRFMAFAFESTPVATGVAVTETELPTDAAFLTASPSVTRGGTMLRASRPFTEAKTVHVFDISGRLVQSLVMAAGARRIQWDGRDFTGAQTASGVYWARIGAQSGGAAKVVRLR